MDLTRTQLLKGNYSFPKDFVKLWRTKHFAERLKERGMATLTLPSSVKIDKKNIHSGKTEDGKTLTSVVIRVPYTKDVYVFLCFDPNDGGLKTLWFRDKRERNGNSRRDANNQDSKQTVSGAGNSKGVLWHP